MPEQPTLSDMIKEVVRTGVTYQQLVDRATDSATGNAGISSGQLNRLAHGHVNRIPTEPQLRAIASALRQPYEAVRKAAIAQWLPVDRGAVPPAPAGIDPKEWAKWTPEDREMVLDAVAKAAQRRAVVNHSNEGARDEVA